MRAGLLGSAPVYFRSTDTTLEISYDLADFFFRPTTIDLEMACRRLALNADYSARQLCSGVIMLTERATIYAESGKIRYVYPSPAEAAAPSEEGGIDHGIGRFEQLLHRALSIRPISKKIALELSGGMDSSTVACALAQSHENIASLGILLDGDGAHSQAEWRHLLIETHPRWNDWRMFILLPSPWLLQPARSTHIGDHSVRLVSGKATRIVSKRLSVGVYLALGGRPRRNRPARQKN